MTIKELQAFFNLSNQEFADLVGIRKREYMYYRAGQRNPSRTVAHKIAQITETEAFVNIEGKWEWRKNEDRESRTEGA
jgi:transcriptional regulator with XRE-family HTH domain